MKNIRRILYFAYICRTHLSLAFMKFAKYHCLPYYKWELFKVICVYFPELQTGTIVWLDEKLDDLNAFGEVTLSSLLKG